ncbi:hypothetical protein SDC9_180101 [bioreactor metagenome]|uniref:Uncharacterized protein n=1 Tax=bioreactor metagenome TaxID=1076179 RepID=A0A645H0N9_9ZZZZ
MAGDNTEQVLGMPLEEAVGQHMLEIELQEVGVHSLVQVLAGVGEIG